MVTQVMEGARKAPTCRRNDSPPWKPSQCWMQSVAMHLSSKGEVVVLTVPQMTVPQMLCRTSSASPSLPLRL